MHINKTGFQFDSSVFLRKAANHTLIKCVSLSLSEIEGKGKE